MILRVDNSEMALLCILSEANLPSNRQRVKTLWIRFKTFRDHLGTLIVPISDGRVTAYEVYPNPIQVILRFEIGNPTSSIIFSQIVEKRQVALTSHKEQICIRNRIELVEVAVTIAREAPFVSLDILT